MALAPVSLNINYQDEQDRITHFLKSYKEGSQGSQATQEDAMDIDTEDEDQDDAVNTRDSPLKPKYMTLLQSVANRVQNSITIDLDDIATFEQSTSGLVSRIRNNTKRYSDIFSRAIDAIMPSPTIDISYKDDVLDMIMHQRREQDQRNAENDRPPFPPELTRRYDLYLKTMRNDQALAVRQVRGAHLGHLITVRGIVTRVSDVKPFLLVNAYSCDMCGSEIFQEVKARQFTPITECTSDECQKNGSKGQLYMQTRASKFVPFQEVKIQEMTDQVPVGHIPRSMTINVYGSLTRGMNPGDVVHISGIFLPTPYTGFKAIRAGLLTDTYLECHHIRQLKKQYEAMETTPEILARINELSQDSDLYNKLAQSIAPEIYGHDDVKKALLLLLVGGVTKSVGDGMKIRGDINICLMGDPGVAKSQLLKYISKVAPRGVYTTGKGSSGVGLTAAVMRDPVTDEMVLEGGALVLADNGICCIDEFDKMEETDRTAIHEVMEQQTISISKAGITTTLNARTSILAAANPLYGRYNPRYSPTENINLPAALLSRFDVLFLILDTPTRDDDERLAQHVTYVHMHSTHPALEFEPLEPNMMRHYVAKARQYRPVIPKSVSDYIVGAYVQLRKQSKEDDKNEKAFTYTSARTLLGILRLSQALARLRFAPEVTPSDVDEALRLVDVSKATLQDSQPTLSGDQTPMSKIYRIVRDMRNLMASGAEEDAADYEPELLMREIRERVVAKGFTEQQLMDCITEYEGMDVWQRFGSGMRLRFL